MSTIPAVNIALGMCNDLIGGASLTWRYHHQVSPPRPGRRGRPGEGGWRAPGRPGAAVGPRRLPFRPRARVSLRPIAQLESPKPLAEAAPHTAPAAAPRPRPPPLPPPPPAAPPGVPPHPHQRRHPGRGRVQHVPHAALRHAPAAPLVGRERGEGSGAGFDGPPPRRGVLPAPAGSPFGQPCPALALDHRLLHAHSRRTTTTINTSNSNTINTATNITHNTALPPGKVAPLAAPLHLGGLPRPPPGLPARGLHLPPHQQDRGRGAAGGEHAG
jgi:hypothetical protein